jgi:hypothetical protein
MGSILIIREILRFVQNDTTEVDFGIRAGARIIAPIFSATFV